MAAVTRGCCSVRWHRVCCYSSLPGIFGASETVCRWRSRLSLFSPTWWFRLVGVPQACQVQSPWWCQIVSRQSSLSSSNLYRNHSYDFLFSFFFFSLTSVCSLLKIADELECWIVQQLQCLHDKIHPHKCATVKFDLNISALPFLFYFF